MSTSTKRQLIVCCDGTNNNLTGKTDDTNLVKLAELLAADPDAQRIVFYDPGVGNPGELPGVTFSDQIKHVKERIAGLAFGRGVYENIGDCYRFLMNEYQEGDEIYIFGFSRGAFTARSVAGMVNLFGLLVPQLDNFVPTLLYIYFSERPRNPGATGAPPQWQIIADQATRLFVAQPSQQVEIQYVGVWDTVATVGMFPFNAKFASKPTIVQKRYRNVRHALALDEMRAQFAPRLYMDANGNYQTQAGNVATLKQVWFQGDHCDVGGGHPTAESGNSNIAYCWLVSEAVLCGLALKNAGGPLDTEAKVAQALAGAYVPPSSPPTVHSQLFETCLWAVTGMTVRDTQNFKLDDGTPFHLPLQAHTAPSAPGAFPKGTEWERSRSKGGLLAAIVAMVVIYLIMGQLLVQQGAFADLVNDPLQLLRLAPNFAAANTDFARWQLTWLWGGALSYPLENFWAPRWAIVWDLLFILLYAYVLSWFAVRSFARAAGVRQAGAKVSKVLNLLGWSLTVMVCGDVLENIFTWLSITSTIYELTLLSWLFGLLMSVFALMKVVGFAGVVLLILRGLKAG